MLRRPDPATVSDYAPRASRSPTRAPQLHADDRERLEYLHARILDAVPPSPDRAVQASARLALAVDRLAERGDDWAIRVQRYWSSTPPSGGSLDA